jgi:uncharacterized damage-inducible protein DinB
MLKTHFEQLAAYNQWANQRLYREAGGLPDEARKRDLGLFFRSLHGTLNHLLVGDRIWLRQLTGEGPEPKALNEILFKDFAELNDAREQEDARIIRFVGALSEADLDAFFAYRTLTGKENVQRRGETLAHFCNPQTHHRGQAHAALTILGITEPAPLDLLVMQRSKPVRRDPGSPSARQRAGPIRRDKAPGAWHDRGNLRPGTPAAAQCVSSCSYVTQSPPGTIRSCPTMRAL